jgi:hypothetical protein
MNLKYAIYRLQRICHDNPSMIMLAVCGVAAVMFIGFMFLPRWLRRRARRRREKRRSAQI